MDFGTEELLTVGVDVESGIAMSETKRLPNGNCDKRKVRLSSLPVEFYLLSRVAVGLLLFAAGLSKIALENPVILAGRWMVPANVVFGLGAVECFAGCAVLSLRPSKTLRRVVMFTLSAFSVYLIFEWSGGRKFCSCFGGSGAPVFAMLLVDFSLLVCVVVQRKAWEHGCSFPAGLLEDVILGIRFVGPCLMVCGVWWFGSPQAAFGYLAGNPVVCPRPVRVVGPLEPGRRTLLRFELRNTSSQPVRIVGSSSSCGCFATSDLPLSMDAHEEATLFVRFNARPMSGTQRESIELMFDDSLPNLLLGVSGLVCSEVAISEDGQPKFSLFSIGKLR